MSALNQEPFIYYHETYSNSQDQSFSCRIQWQDDGTGELNGGGDLPVTQQGLRDAGARPPVPVEAEHALVVRGRWRQADE